MDLKQNMSSFSNLIILRSGKTMQFRQNPIKKKKRSQKKITNNYNQTLSFLDSSSIDYLEMRTMNNNSYKKLVIVSNYNFYEDDFYKFIKSKSGSINEDPFDKQNNISSTSCTNFKNDCLLNDIQHKQSEVNLEACSMPESIIKEKTKLAVLSSKPKRKNITIKPTRGCGDHSIINQSTDVRITRGKKLQLEIEKRKELDQILLNKYDGLLKEPVVELQNIAVKIQFFSKLGLKYSHKCSVINSLKC